MSLNGVFWYVRARGITVTASESFDDLMVLIQHYNKDIKEGRLVDACRVQKTIFILYCII